MTTRLDFEAMADALAEWVATGVVVSEMDRQVAREALEAIGVAAIVERMAMAERIIRFGNSFHSVAGFFADGTPEQDYIRQLTSTERALRRVSNQDH